MTLAPEGMLPDNPVVVPPMIHVPELLAVQMPKYGIPPAVVVTIANVCGEPEALLVNAPLAAAVHAIGGRPPETGV